MLESFSPIVGLNPTVLILGSMPSQKSLEIQQYYGHPQNSFWWVMANTLGFSVDLPYSEKVRKLEQNGVAVWDVLQKCKREGSLDSNIMRNTEVANDIPGFLKEHLSIKFLGFNGGAAKAIYRRHIGLIDKNHEIIQLPSTSPAHASITKQQKYKLWQQAMLPYLKG